jgi:hypothetical protein
MDSLVSPGLIGSLFLFAAASGIIVLVLVTIFAFIGADDPTGEAHIQDGLDLFSLRSVSTALAAFGLTGFILLQMGFWGPLALALAIPVGLVSGVGVAYLLRGMTRLAVDGSPDLQRAVGEAATVYIMIPEQGTGRIMLPIQGQTLECDAVSMDGPLAPGQKVIVTSVLEGEVLEVQIYPSLKELTA